MFSNLSYKQIRYVSMRTSLFVGLIEDLGLHLSLTKVHSSFLNSHVSQNFLLYSSNSVFNFVRFISLTVRTNFRPLDSNYISEEE